MKPHAKLTARLTRLVLALFIVQLLNLPGLAVSPIATVAQDAVRLQVGPIGQLLIGDAGKLNCTPASIAMALQAIDPTGMSDGLRYREVVRTMRKRVPNVAQGIGYDIAETEMGTLTGNRWTAQQKVLSAEAWTDFLGDQLLLGRPVVTYINDAKYLVGGRTFPGPHSILVTGISGTRVWYNDPWDGSEHDLSRESFAAAWGNTLLPKTREHPEVRENPDGAWRALFFVPASETTAPSPTPIPSPPSKPTTVAPTPTSLPTIQPIVTAAPAQLPTLQPVATSIQAPNQELGSLPAGSIAFAGNDGNIWLMRPDGSGLRQMTSNGTPDTPYGHPKWSSDGSMLVFDWNGNAGGDPSSYLIYLMQNGGIQPIPNVFGCALPDFSVGDRTVVFACGYGTGRGGASEVTEDVHSNPSEGFISESDLNGENWRVLTFFGSGSYDWAFGHVYAYHLDVSPSDGSIAVSSAGGAGDHFDIFDAAGVRIPDPCANWVCGDGPAAQAVAATYASDGGQLVAAVCTGGYCAHRRDGFVVELLMLGSDGVPQQSIATLPPDLWASAPSAAPGTQTVVYSAWASGSSVDGSQVFVVSPGNAPVPIAAGSDPVWQPVAVEIGDLSQDAGDGASMGSVTVSLYQCPAGMTSMTLDPAACQLGDTGLRELTLWNWDLDQFRTIADAEGSGGVLTWTGLPFGTYNLAPEFPVEQIGSIYVPGLESYDGGSATVDWDDVTYPASPEYTVSVLEGTGYRVPLDANDPNRSLDVFVFGGLCPNAGCEDQSSIAPNSDPSAAAQSGRVEVGVVSCPGQEPEIVADGPSYFAYDWGAGDNPCIAPSQPQTVVFTNEAGQQTEFSITGSTEVDLPFGQYQVVHLETGMETTLTLLPTEWYIERCSGGYVCPRWSVFVELGAVEAIAPAEPAQTSGDDGLVFQGLQSFVGDWTGTFSQSNPQAEWQINLSFWSGNEGEIVGSIEYVGAGCSGDLILLPVMLDFGLALREDITAGEDACVDGGTFNLERNGASGLTFTWMHEGSDTTGHGTLQKVGATEPLPAATGSLEVHAVFCPAGFSGPDYFNTCHGNGASGWTFIVDSASLTLSITTAVESSPGPGIARLSNLVAGTYVLMSVSDSPGSPAYVFCSPDQGATVLVDRFMSESTGVDVPINGQAVVCDWYLLSQ